MALDRNSNAFTFGFAIVMVIVVGAILASLSLGLKPYQLKNEDDKKMIDILGAIGVEAGRENAKELFDQYVTERIVLDYNGKVVSTNSGEIDRLNKDDAFNKSIQAEYRDRTIGVENRSYPLYRCTKNDSIFYVIPMVGNGLWAAIWGFVALGEDYNTVYGAKFDHKSETPGLGAEINQAAFQAPFKGKKLTDASGTYKSIEVRKGGALEGNLHQVDAITGGTITSNGVTEMLHRTLQVYTKYFNSLKTNQS
jgi:Na+-transporting NADH:ubiquinone oxidoreductase subunit C